MAFYAVDVRDQVIQRVTWQYDGVRDNKRFFLIEAVSAKQAWAKASRASAAIGSADCSGCPRLFVVAKPGGEINGKRSYAMGDKSKKDKEKAGNRKKQAQTAKRIWRN